MITPFANICTDYFQFCRTDSTEFWGTFYVIDKSNGNVLTIPSTPWRGGNKIDVRKINASTILSTGTGWRVEYFCENEGLIFQQFSNGESACVADKLLNCSYDMKVKGQVFTFYSTWISGMGNLRRYYDEARQKNDLEISISETQAYIAGSDHIRHSINIGNVAKLDSNITYIYQDAAYLDFEDGCQDNVFRFFGYKEGGSVRIKFDKCGSHKMKKNFEFVFAGNYNPAGTLSMLISNSIYSTVGNIDYYIGFEIQEQTPHGTLYIINNGGEFISPLIESESGYIPQKNSLKNIFCKFDTAHHFGESKDLVYYRYFTQIFEHNKYNIESSDTKDLVTYIISQIQI